MTPAILYKDPLRLKARFSNYPDLGSEFGGFRVRFRGLVVKEDLVRL